MDKFFDRINQIKERLLSPEFLNNSGLGNEIGFYIFDYPPERELDIRSHLEAIRSELPEGFVVINLFSLIVDYLKREEMLEPALGIQVSDGDGELLAAFRGVIEGERIAPLIAKAAGDSSKAILITGIGNAFPLLRTHDLLNNLQVLMKNKPLVVFYPGRYDLQTLSLFGELKDENYYRAFRLVA